MRHALLLGLLFSLAACNATQTAKHAGLEPLDSLAKVDFLYRGTISGAGLPSASPHSNADDLAGNPLVDTYVRIYEVSKDAIHEVLQDGAVRMRADRVQADAALEILESLVESGDAALICNPRMLLPRGGHSNMTVANDFSYVGSYVIKQAGTDTLVDPTIKVGREGVLLEVASLMEDKPGQCSVDFKLSLSALQLPLLSGRIELPGARGTIEIDSPFYSTQELSFRSTLSEDNALLIGPLPPYKGKWPLIVLVKTIPVPLPAEQTIAIHSDAVKSL